MMERKGISQEMLKLIACITMLIDHIGYALVASAYSQSGTRTLFWLYWACRIVGRIAFPIYCFLLAEGAHYTRHSGKYALRLLTGALLAEVPFDLVFFGGLTMEHQSVMLTLLLGFVMLQCMKKTGGIWQYVILVPFYYAADKLHCDYGGMGIALIALFHWSRGMEGERIIRFVGMAILFSRSFVVTMGTMQLPLGLFALLALIPICSYSGKKQSRSKALQWAFYLFYPAHMAALWLLNGLL